MVASTQASSDLCWRVIRQNNAFRTKQRAGRGRDRIVLSSEPKNLLNKSSFKYSAIVHDNSIGLELSEKGVVVSRNGSKDIVLPAKKVIGMRSRMARKGRKDLGAAIRMRAIRLQRLNVRKSRKSWKNDA
ncbi:60S ribosomal protein L28 [Diplonema papillatum]|nr:60S ribosomal protein L28 [Diplonema papillatum]